MPVDTRLYQRCVRTVRDTTGPETTFGWVAFQQAAKYGVKYILSGSNFASESILPQARGYNPDDAKHLKEIHKQYGSVTLKTASRRLPDVLKKLGFRR